MKKISLPKNTLKKLSYGKELHPSRDWLILIALFCIALLGSVAWNLWLFSDVTNGNIIGSATSTPQSQIQLDGVKGIFEQRAEEERRFRSEYRLVDPSL